MFAPVEETNNSHALYQKVGDVNCWLGYCANGSWVVGDSKDGDENRGWACSASSGLSQPTEASVWKVKSVDSMWVEQAAVRVESALPVGATQYQC